MTSRVRAIIGVAIMSILLVLYFVFVGVRAFALLASGAVIPIVMGVCLLLLPLLGAWALGRELLFGYQATQLVDRLAAAGKMPLTELPSELEGVALREAADARFADYREAVTQNAESWQAWLRLGLVYDACADRKRARSAIRRAIVLARKHD